MGYTWVAFGAGVLSALLTCRMCYEPWSMPVALKLSHWALTTTDGAGFVYRTGLLVSLNAQIWQLYDNIWQLYVKVWQLYTLVLDRGVSKRPRSADLQ